MNWVSIASGNGFAPNRRQAITWTKADLLLIGPLGTYFSEILIEIQTFSFKKMHLKMPSGKWWLSCPGDELSAADIYELWYIALVFVDEWYAMKMFKSLIRAFHIFQRWLDIYYQFILTHIPWTKVATIWQRIFWDTFSWLKRFLFWLKFHWSLFLWVQLTISHHWFR